MTDDDLAVVRRAYAKHALAVEGLDNPGLEAALAAVKREHYLGPGPWPILRRGAYVESADPVHLYADDLVGIDTARGLNNGQPSFLALLIDRAAPAPGDHAVHVGAGLGYYTALVAEMVGVDGRVTSIEFDAGLATRARANLAHYPQVACLTGDGAAVPIDPADVILVNVGVTRPADLWLDRLREGGRLVLPLTVSKGELWRSGAGGGRGAVFLVTHRGGGFDARRVSGVGIFHSASLRDPRDERALAAAFASGDGSEVTRLHRGDARPGEGCWLAGDGWCLTTG